MCVYALMNRFLSFREQMEMSFLMYQRFYERLPERLKQNQEEAQLYAQMPEALSNLREDRRACFPDEDE